ncbi:MarR family winged helix-turn-helix transcriptional regulator [Nocardioides jensenii]|uniref:MarR family winged helix-turn-helix transcriptional regulator n=1 Tax=Nocardioides jensenii TaxID=1843 RepID=UPI000AB978A0|nr:MarR family winged helix-turn-helix transcriptional regulator [Nocardioides jensenii]
MDTSNGAEDLAEAYRLLVADAYEFAGASRRASEALARDLGQTAARWNLLSVVSDGPRSVASAARRLGLARQSVQRVANDLVGIGALRRETDPNDARAPLLVLTDAGRDVLAASVRSSDADRADRLARAGVSPDELQAAREVLRRLAAALA